MKINEITSKLPEDVIEAFTELANMQRGEPEHLMLKVQMLMGGGVINPVVEHTGDLIHRMTHLARYNNFGREYVKEKTERVLRALKHPYGFVKEFNENIITNAKYKGVEDAEEFKNKISIALQKYANSFKKLPVYNNLQWSAKYAAIHVGEQDFSKAIQAISYIDRIADNREKYERKAREYSRDSFGNLKVIKF